MIKDGTLPFEGAVKAPFEFVWPVNNPHITSDYGMRTITINGSPKTHFHNGIDLIANPWCEEALDVKAAGNGKVTFNEWCKYGGGWTVRINHAGGYQTRYAHLKAQPKIKVNSNIKAGQFIEQMGATGTATGVHLHFGAYKNNQHFDPKLLMPKK